MADKNNDEDNNQDRSIISIEEVDDDDNTNGFDSAELGLLEDLTGSKV